MPIRLHLGLLFITQIICLIGGFMLGMSIHEVVTPSLPEILQDKYVRFIVFGMLPAAAAVYAAGLVFRYVIAARCPECGGRSIYHASRSEKAVLGGKNTVPVTYHCQVCGHVHRTNVFPTDPQP